MKANELRIGNLVIANGLYQGSLVIVNQIGQQGTLSEDKRVILFEGLDVGEFVKDLKPIPLTEEWLLKFGFFKRDNYWFEINYFTDCELKTEKNGIVINLNTGRCGVYALDEEDYFTMIAYRVEYVHELQNLYFALTKKELTYEQTN